MRRWNGWGEVGVEMPLPPAAQELLREAVGDGRARPDDPLERLLARVPKARLRPHRLLSFDLRARLDHAHGQSLPDWVRLRGGTLERFPDAVALPTTMEEVDEVLRVAVEQDAAIIPFGGGTSVVGHLDVPATDRPVISLSLERLERLLEIQPENLLATFEAGVRGPRLEARLGERGFTLGHYPQSFEYSTLGGWVATRSSGQQSAHYGRIERLFQGGEVATPQGLLRIPAFPASAAGPDLRHWILGSEGRAGILTKAIVRIAPRPEIDEVYGFFFPSWKAARDAVRELAVSGVSFSMIRLSNATETKMHLALSERQRDVGLLEKYLKVRGIPLASTCMCLVGFTGSPRPVRAARQDASSIIRQHRGVGVGRGVGRAWKKLRFRSAYLRNTLWERGYAVDTLETAVGWDKVGPTMEAIAASLEKAIAAWNERVLVLMHLSSVYPTGSSIYVTIVFRPADSAEETLEQWRAFKGSASRAIVEAGGTISHQHGVGVDHRDYLEAEKGRLGIVLVERAVNVLDPDQRMNPTKLLPARGAPWP